MAKPLVIPVTAQITGSIDHPEFKPEIEQDLSKLKQGEYFCTMPLIGEHIAFYGKKEVDPQHYEKLAALIKNVLTSYQPFINKNLSVLKKSPQLISEKMATLEFEQLLEKIKDICSKGLKNEYLIRVTLILALYEALSETYIPWDKNKKLILSIYKPVFSLLVKMRASYHWLRTAEETHERTVFKDLLIYGLDQESINIGFAHYRLDDIEIFEQMLKVYLAAGADINTLCHVNPKLGTFLHINIANEFEEIPELLQLIEKYTDKKHIHTQLNYKLRDSLENTPLLLAIRTRNEKAVLALLELEKNSSVGIDMVDSEGRSPLMLACSYGMKHVVEKLLQLGANVNIKDKRSWTYQDYASIEKKYLYDLIAPFIHPDRVDATVTTPHSYLYASEAPNLPLCYYPEGHIKKETEQNKYLVVLSNEQPYQEILIKVIETLKQQKDEASQKNWKSAILQFDDIRFSAQYKRVLEYLEKNQQVAELKTWYLPFKKNEGRQAKLYGDALDDIVTNLTILARHNKDLMPHVLQITQLKNSSPAPSFIQKCIKGEEAVRAYLATPEAVRLIKLSQQKALVSTEAFFKSKEQDLRQAAALGDLTKVQALLKEKVNPAAPEFKSEGYDENKRLLGERNALDYAIWRGGMVETLIKEQARREYKQYNTKSALEMHPEIIKTLLANSMFTSTTMARVKKTLEVDIKNPGNPQSKKSAEQCLKVIEEYESSLTP